MKRNSALTLNIPHPCTQSWNEMTQAAGGRHCLHCQQTVTDFSTMTDQEIIAALSSNEEHRCGRFLPEQLHRNLQARTQPRHSFLPAAMLTSLIAAITPDSSEAKNLADTTVQSVRLATDSVIKENPPGLLTGEIIDPHTNEPLAGVTITLKDDVRRYSGTWTDNQGQFRYNIPDDHRGRPLTLLLTYVGYDTKEVSFDTASLSLPAKILMNRSNVNLREIEIAVAAPKVVRKWEVMGSITIIRRPTLWQRFKHLFKRHHGANCKHH